MSDDKTVTIDGVDYYFDTTGEDGGNVCLDCVAHLGEKLCLQLPDCLRGVWKVKPLFTDAKTAIDAAYGKGSKLSEAIDALLAEAKGDGK